MQPCISEEPRSFDSLDDGEPRLLDEDPERSFLVFLDNRGSPDTAGNSIFQCLRGYRSAIGDRINYKATQIVGDAETQFLLGMEDMQAGRCGSPDSASNMSSAQSKFSGIQDRLASPVNCAQPQHPHPHRRPRLRYPRPAAG
jgi:hypothetical protein